jgi:hypothetical protein
VLVVVVCVQAAMLHSKGWRISMGSFPEYLAAVGSFATFGVLWFEKPLRHYPVAYSSTCSPNTGLLLRL